MSVMDPRIGVKIPGLRLPVQIDRRFGILGHHLAFDNGILRTTFSDRKAFDQFWGSLPRINNYLTAQPVFYNSPFMLFEFLGLRLEDYDYYRMDRDFKKQIKAIFSSTNIKNCGKQLLQAKKLFEAKIRAQPEMKDEHLVELLEKYLKPLAPWAKQFVDDLFRTKANLIGTSKRWINAIAFDRIQTIPFEELVSGPAILNAIDWHFINFTNLQMGTEQINYSCARALDQIVKRHFQMKRSLLFNDPNCDGHDSQIVHHLVAGFRADGKSHSVCVFTNEKLENWIPRIQNQIIVIGEISQILKDKNPPIVSPGLLFEVEKNTGKIRGHYLDIKRHFNTSKLVFQ